MRLESATKEQVAAIYRESYALWGVGLSLSDYEALWEDVNRTVWAQQNVRFYVWLDEGDRVRSSLKVYRPRMRVGDRVCRASVLGAIFTPRDCRRRGYAGQLVQAVLELGRRCGDAVAMLFSDIGTEYYEAFGFKALPSEEQWGVLPRKPPAPDDAWTLRPQVDADLDAVRSAHEDTMASRPIAFLRDRAHWDFLRVRSDSYFNRLRDPGVRQTNRVATHHGRFVGFLTAVEGRGEWNVREVGAHGGDPRAMSTILRLGAVAARQTGLRKYYAWLPPDVVEQMPDWKIQTTERRRAVPMILSLDEGLDLGDLMASRSGYIPYQDQF